MSARLLFIGLWNFADDEGNIEANEKMIKALVFPSDDCLINPFLDELCQHKLIVQYTVTERNYYHIRGFKKHQLINRPSPSRCPKLTEDSRRTHGGLTEDSRRTHGGLTEDSLQEGKGREGKVRDNTLMSDSDEVRLSELLLSLIQKRNPVFKKPDVQKWGNEIGLVLRVDKRPVKEVEAVIYWCQADSFWQNNILSPGKLRKQYDQLLMKMKYQKGVTTSVDDRKKSFLGKP